MLYSTLFFSTFLSATLVPVSSEAVVAYYFYNYNNHALILFVATIGNSLGGLTNYFIGYLGKPVWLEKFGLNHEKRVRLEHRIQRYGAWLAWLGWVPIIGDPMLIALGFFRTPFWWSTLFMVLGKFIRYLILFLFFYHS